MDPMEPTRLLCSWDSPGKNTGVGCHSLLQGNLPDPGIKPRSPALQTDSLLSEPPGKTLVIIDVYRSDVYRCLHVSTYWIWLAYYVLWCCNALWITYYTIVNYFLFIFYITCLTIYFILEYSWLTMLYYFQVYNKVIQLYKHMYLFFFKLFPI